MLVIKLSIKIVNKRIILLLTYDRNIDDFLFYCNPVTSFSLFQGTGVFSLVLPVNWIDLQTSIRKCTKPCPVQFYFILSLPLNLWGWSSFSTTAYSLRTISNDTLLKVHLSKSCCWKKHNNIVSINNCSSRAFNCYYTLKQV